MPANAAHTSRWRIAEVVFGGPFLAAYLWYAVRVPLLPSPATLAAAHLGEAPAAPGGAEPLGA